MADPKVLLGDDVYAEWQGRTRDDKDKDVLVLTIENGFGTTNAIALEPVVLHALLYYLKRAGRNDPRCFCGHLHSRHAKGRCVECSCRMFDQADSTNG